MTDAMLEKFKIALNVLIHTRDADDEVMDVSWVLMNLHEYPLATTLTLDFTGQQEIATLSDECIINVIGEESYRSKNDLWVDCIEHDWLEIPNQIYITKEESKMTLPLDHPLVIDAIIQLRMMEL